MKRMRLQLAGWRTSAAPGRTPWRSENGCGERREKVSCPGSSTRREREKEERAQLLNFLLCEFVLEVAQRLGGRQQARATDELQVDRGRKVASLHEKSSDHRGVKSKKRCREKSGPSTSLSLFLSPTLAHSDVTSLFLDLSLSPILALSSFLFPLTSSSPLTHSLPSFLPLLSPQPHPTPGENETHDAPNKSGPRRSAWPACGPGSAR